MTVEELIAILTTQAPKAEVLIHFDEAPRSGVEAVYSGVNTYSGDDLIAEFVAIGYWSGDWDRFSTALDHKIIHG